MTAEKVKSKVDNLKNGYRAWVDITSLSGWSIDEKGLPKAEQAVMDAYFTAHKEARKFKRAPLENEAELAFLFDGTLASGNHATGITAAQKRSQARAQALMDLRKQKQAAVTARAAAIVAAASGESFSSTESASESIGGTGEANGAMEDSSDASFTAAQIGMRKRVAEGYAKEKRKLARASGPEQMGGALDNLAKSITEISTTFTTVSAPTPVQRAARIVWSFERFSMEERMMAATKLTKRRLAEMFIEAPEAVQVRLIGQYVTEEQLKQVEQVERLEDPMSP